MELYKIIREERIALGMTQEVLALKINLTRPEISEIESGRRKISTDELILIAKAFDTTPSILLQSNDTSERLILELEVLRESLFQEAKNSKWYNTKKALNHTRNRLRILIEEHRKSINQKERIVEYKQTL